MSGWWLFVCVALGLALTVTTAGGQATNKKKEAALVSFKTALEAKDIQCRQKKS